MLKILYILAIILFSTMSNASEDRLFKSFSSDNPMSYRFTMSIAQDKDGFMWFGAQEGLHRFDGHKLVSYYHEAEKENSLSSNVISRVLIDKKQNFWIGTRGGGVNLFNNDMQSFTHITTKTHDAALTSDAVNTLYEDTKGQIWVGTENGLNIIRRQNERWSVQQIYQQLGNENTLSNNTIHAITETNNEIWIGTNGGGISVFNFKGEFQRTMNSRFNKKDYITKFINSLFTDADDVVWIGTTDKGLVKYDATLDQFISFQTIEGDSSSVSSNTIHYVYQDLSKRIWIATDNGLSIYNEKQENFERFNHSPNNQYSVSNDFIMTLFEDNDGLMWIGTFTGVNRWDPTMTTFKQYTETRFPILNAPNVTSFTQINKNEIVFSTYSGGIFTLNKSENSIQRLAISSYFTDMRIMTLFSDDNILWVGTRASGLYKIDMLTGTSVAYEHDEKDDRSISANSITDIIKDKSGNIWVSTFYQGLNRLNKNDEFTRYVNDKDRPELGPSSNSILHLLEDEQGVIWIATYGAGLNRYDPMSQKFLHINHDDNNVSSISSDLTWFLFIDNNKSLWIGTQAAGLNILSYADRVAENFSFTHLDTKDGMKSQTIYGLSQDEYDDIWLSSNQGVSRFTPSSKRFKHFDLSHGLVDLDFNHSAIFKDSMGTLYFGSGKGFSSVEPTQSNITLSAPKVRLTNILKLNTAIKAETALSEVKKLTLNYDDQLVSFEYVGLNYTNPDSTQYKYRLLGFDQEWLDAGKSRRVSYTNLPAGNYQLQVIAGNNDNIWSDPGLSLNIIVKSAPWNTWWAYILYTLAVALSLLFYSRLLNRKLVIEQQQKLYLEQQVHEKTEKFKSKNLELAQANKQLEKAAIVDKVTGVKSRRYLDIYIEQTSQLMNQMHQNLLPVQRDMLPRLYILMVQLKSYSEISNSQLINITDLLLYSRNNDDLVIRWSHDTFAVIGYEKGNNANELAARLAARLKSEIDDSTSMNMAYSFFPFSRENPLDLTWDQISVLIEQALTFTDTDPQLAWLGLCGPKSARFDYLQLMQKRSLVNLKEQVITKSGLN